MRRGCGKSFVSGAPIVFGRDVDRDGTGTGRDDLWFRGIYRPGVSGWGRDFFQVFLIPIPREFPSPDGGNSNDEHTAIRVRRNRAVSRS